MCVCVFSAMQQIKQFSISPPTPESIVAPFNHCKTSLIHIEIEIFPLHSINYRILPKKKQSLLYTINRRILSRRENCGINENLDSSLLLFLAHGICATVIAAETANRSFVIGALFFIQSVLRHREDNQNCAASSTMRHVRVLHDVGTDSEYQWNLLPSEVFWWFIFHH